MNMRKNFLRIFVLVFLFSSPLFLMSYDDTKDFETAKNLDIFYSLFSEISNSYVDELAPGDLMSRTINEMLKTLDPYTNYIPESDVERYTIMSKGEYGGIGASVTKRDNALMITDIQKNSPAQAAGIILGDRIVEIDGHSIINTPYDEAMQLLQGQMGTTMKLGIIRNGERKNFSIERKNIKINSVPYYGMLTPEIGYIKLNEFSQLCSVDVLKACKKLLGDDKAKGLVLDLRGNPGGLLIEAINIVNIFIPAGERIVFTKGQNKTENSKFSTQNEPFAPDIPLVVLVNDRSASAAEIVSGALQDLDRAVVIGNQTFGKGLVQTRKELAHNSLLKITTSKYYIPSGRCIQKLDYTHRDAEGNPTIVPDSLQKTFYTRNHRPVKDGGGIIPDVTISKDSSSALLQDLLSEFVIFDFINTQYSQADTTSIKPETYVFTDEDYQKFITFCERTGYTFHSESEKLLASFAKAADKEHLDISSQVSVLQKNIDKQQADLFQNDKAQISKEIESLVIRNLYTEEGQCKYLTRNDKFISEAKKYLTDSKLYNSVLKGK